MAQVKSVLQDPKLLNDAPHRVIYNELLNPEAYKGLPRPSVSRLCDDARALFAAGSHTIGTTLITGVYHLLHNPEIKQKLLDELRTVWPVLDQPPSYEQLEKLPFLVSAFICQSWACSQAKDGTDCCDQRNASHGYTDTRWPSARSATIWCRNIRR